jgi:hypothetical protein
MASWWSQRRAAKRSVDAYVKEQLEAIDQYNASQGLDHPLPDNDPFGGIYTPEKPHAHYENKLAEAMQGSAFGSFATFQ